MSRRVYLLGVGLALVALALAFTDWALSLRPGVTEANVRRIRSGMTLKEAEAVLGGPGQRRGGFSGLGHCAWIYEWTGTDGTAIVRIWWSQTKPREVVDYTDFRRTPSPSLLARLRAWLGW